MVLLAFHGVSNDGAIVPGRILECPGRLTVAQEIERLLTCPHLDDRGVVRLVFDVALDVPAPVAVATASR